jgi:hypothetical protein
MVAAAASSVRTGEFAASPWVDERGGPRGSGYIIQSGELPGIASSVDRIDMQLYEPVMIAPPVGAAPPARQLYLAYKLGPFIEEFGQIVIPTGIVEVTRTPQTGEATVARVLKKFGVVRRDQRLIAYDSSAGVVRGAPLPVLNGRMGTVRWILNQPVLPTLQSYLVLDLKRSEGVNTGDRASPSPRSRSAAHKCSASHLLVRPRSSRRKSSPRSRKGHRCGSPQRCRNLRSVH